jgi:hypothetical protein
MRDLVLDRRFGRATIATFLLHRVTLPAGPGQRLLGKVYYP